MPGIRNESVAELLRLAIESYNSLLAELENKRTQLAAMLTGETKSAAIKAVAPKKSRRLSAEARAKISAAQKARWAKDRKEKAEDQKSKVAQSKAKPVKAAPISVKKKVKAQTAETGQSKAKFTKPVTVKKKAQQQAPKAAPLKAKLIKAASIPVKEKAELQTPRTSLSTARPVKATPASANPKLSPARKTKSTKISLARKALAQRGQKNKTPQTPKPDASTPAGIIEQMALAGARFRITQGGSLVIGNLGSLPPAVQRMFLDYPAPHLLTAAARRHLAANQSPR